MPAQSRNRAVAQPAGEGQRARASGRGPAGESRSQPAGAAFAEDVLLDSSGQLIARLALAPPASINTPFPQHAKNYLSHEPRLPDPVYPPKEVALAILKAAQQPWRDIRVGGASPILAALANWTPRLMDWVNENIMTKQQMRREPPRHPSGSLYASDAGGREVGSHPGHVMNSSFYTRTLMNPVARGALIASLGMATAAWIGSMRTRK